MIRTLVVDDQPAVADGHAAYVKRVGGFEVAGVVHTGPEAVTRCRQGGIDLVLLDLALPGMHGLDVARALQAMPDGPDVMVLTASRDLQTVRAAMRSGALHYIVKPFTFSMLRDKLVNYSSYREVATSDGQIMDQVQIDAALATLRDPGTGDLAKGISRETLDAVRKALRAEPEGLSASKVGEIIGASRVTARRYLEYLADDAICDRVPLYGRTGRPEFVYRLRRRQQAASPD